MDYGLQDRVILVTGSSQGSGKAVALHLALHGATVVLLSRNARRLEAVYDEIVAAGGPEPAAIPMDLLETSDEQFEQLALQIYKELGRLDGIVHCAALLYALSPLRDQRIEVWMNQFRINTVAPFALTRACLPLLARSPVCMPTRILVGISRAAAAVCRLTLYVGPGSGTLAVSVVAVAP